MSGAGSRVMRIAGIGVVSPLGVGFAAFAASLEAARSPLAAWAAAGAAEGARLAARVGTWNRDTAAPPMLARRLNDASLFALAAAREALAGVSTPLQELGVVLATETAGNHPVSEFLAALARHGPGGVPPSLFPVAVPSAPATQIAIELGARGYNATLSAGGGGMGAALEVALAALDGGHASAVLAGVTEELAPFIWSVRAAAGELAPPGEPAHPLSKSAAGAIAGEGAYLVVIGAGTEGPRLSGLASARRPYDPESAVAEAMSEALARAECAPAAIDAIFSAASGSPGDDAAEAAALRRVFADPPPIVASAGACGDGGSGGGAQLAAALWALSAQRLPASVHAEPPFIGNLPVVTATRAAAMARILVVWRAADGPAWAAVLTR